MIYFSKPSLKAQLLLLCALALLMPEAGSGAAFVWRGTSGNWSDPTKWVGGAAPTGTDATDSLVFGGTATYDTTNNLVTVPTVLNQLVMNSTSPTFTVVHGQPLLFSGPTPSMIQQNVGPFQVNARVQSTDMLTLAGDGGVVYLATGLSGSFDLLKQGTSEFVLEPQVATGTPLAPWAGKMTIDGGRITAGAVALRSNPVSLTSPTSVVGASGNIGELRLGTLSGTSGLVESHPVGTDDSEDLVVHAFSDGTFGGTVRVAPAGSSGKDRGAFIVRGVGRQTLTGAFVAPGSPPASTALQISKDVAVGHGATLTLAGSASLGNQTQGAVILSGGTFELDNRSTNNNNRVRDGDAGSTGVDLQGGGVFKLIGNSAGSSEVAGRLQLGAATNPRSGALSVAVQHNAGSAAATELTFQSLSRDGSGSAFTLATVDFSATDGNGTQLPLGQSGSAPRILFGNPPPLTNGLLRNTRNLNSIVGWATVNGSAFATYGPNGIAPVAVTAPPPGNSNGDASANVEIRGNFAIGPINSPYAVNSLRLEPDSPGQSLTLAGGGLSVQGILLAGERDYTIDGPLQAPFIHVERAALTTGGNAIFGFTKSGEGVLALGSESQAFFTINAGVVRAAVGTAPHAHFRGGVLELTGGGTYGEQISSRGLLNWQGADEFGTPIAEDVGSGGFAAFGSDVIVRLTSVQSALLRWEGAGFVQSGHALIFGSRNADHRVNWASSFSLTESPLSGNYNARELRVNDNPVSSTDVAQLSGEISGQSQNDLLKTGPGTLELTGTNTYTGATLVREGRLLIAGPTGTIAASFLTDIYPGAILGGDGSAGAVKVRSGAMIAPGSLSMPVAIFRTGALTLDSGASLNLEITGLTNGTRQDQLVVTGPVSLDGANVVLSLASGFVPQQNDTFFVLVNDGTDRITGTFAQGTSATIDGVLFEISYTADSVTRSFTGGNDIALRIVPEPVAALSLLAALPLLVGRAAHRRAVCRYDRTSRG